MMPSWSMCSNSLLATLRRSGARRRGRAETCGFDVVLDLVLCGGVWCADLSEGGEL